MRQQTIAKYVDWEQQMLDPVRSALERDSLDLLVIIWSRRYQIVLSVE